MRVIFVSEMRNPLTDASSTQIMTKNLLYGFKNICESLIFAPIIENEKDIAPIVEHYKSLCDEIIPCKSLTKCHGTPLQMLLTTVKSIVHFSKKRIPTRLFELENYTLVSHSPSVDSILICKKILKENKIRRYVQYWGDPYALSLITPEEFYFKRIPDKWIEGTMHKSADKIVFGTKSLYDAEIKLFPKIKNKASFVEVSFNPESKDVQENNKRITIGYFGNYYSNIRNILPFYNAAKNILDADFIICGNSDLKLSSTHNTKVLSRVSQNDVAKLESNIDIVICILNKRGVQIPGKVFYQTNTNKDILVVLDGPMKDEIKHELEESKRFLFCDNDECSITTALKGIINCEPRNYDYSYYDPQKICTKIIE